MAILKSVCELAWRQVFPNPNDETAVTVEEFIETGLLQYSWEMWRLSKEEKREEGVFNIPSNLLTQTELPVKDNVVDIKDLPVLRSLTNDKWLVNVGGLLSKCKYVASNVNNTQLMEDDDSMGDDVKTYLVIGNEIQFPLGVHSNPIKITYANNGLGLDSEEVEISDELAAIIRTKLIDIYSRKGVEDTTNNSSSKS